MENKKIIRSINDLDMNKFFKESQTAVSGAELLNEFNEKAKFSTPMAWSEFHALISRDCVRSYDKAGDGFAAFNLELRKSFSVPQIGEDI